MKLRTLVTISAFLLIATGSVAQGKLTDEEKQKFRENQEAYKKELNLSPEQESAMETVNARYFEGLAALRESGAPKMSKLKEFKRLKKERDSQAKKILDERQYKLFQAHQEEIRSDMRERRKNNR